LLLGRVSEIVSLSANILRLQTTQLPLEEAGNLLSIVIVVVYGVTIVVSVVSFEIVSGIACKDNL
jgi:hypothetical protein